MEPLVQKPLKKGQYSPTAEEEHVAYAGTHEPPDEYETRDADQVCKQQHQFATTLYKAHSIGKRACNCYDRPLKSECVAEASNRPCHPHERSVHFYVYQPVFSCVVEPETSVASRGHLSSYAP